MLVTAAASLLLVSAPPRAADLDGTAIARWRDLRLVRLSGSAEQSGDRMIALSLARSTEDVRSVVDGLRVQG